MSRQSKQNRPRKKLGQRGRRTPKPATEPATHRHRRDDVVAFPHCFLPAELWEGLRQQLECVRVLCDPNLPRDLRDGLVKSVNTIATYVVRRVPASGFNLSEEYEKLDDQTRRLHFIQAWYEWRTLAELVVDKYGGIIDHRKRHEVTPGLLPTTKNAIDNLVSSVLAWLDFFESFAKRTFKPGAIPDIPKPIASFVKAREAGCPQRPAVEVDATVGSIAEDIQQIREFITANRPEKSRDPVHECYLGIVLDVAERTASRTVDSVTLEPVEFRTFPHQWDLFSKLVESGSEGVTREWVEGITKWADKLKKNVNDRILECLRLEVSADRKGVWRLIDITPPTAPP